MTLLRGVAGTAALFVITALVACGGSGDTGDDAGGGDGGVSVTVDPAEALEPAYRAILEAQCESIFACGTWMSFDMSASYVVALARMGSIEGCVEQFARTLVPPPRLDALRAAIEDGRVLFEPEQASACAEAVRVGVCSYQMTDMLDVVTWSFASAPACADLLVGTLELDDPCELEAECGPGLSCTFTPESCGGTCGEAAVPANSLELGEPCSEHAECVVGAACLGGDMRCRTLSLVADQQVGDLCLSPPEITETSITLRGCAPTLGCYSSGDLPVCAARLAAEADCTEDHDAVCAPGYACQKHAEGDTYSCMPLTLSATEGDDCTFELEPGHGPFTFCDTSKRLHCGDTGQCVENGEGAAGATCIVNEDDAPFAIVLPCEDRYFCHPFTEQCTAKKDADASCFFDFECASGRCLGGECTAIYCEADLD